MKSFGRTVLGLVISGAVMISASMAAERPYYQGKTVTFFINFSAGGPTDEVTG